MNDFLLKQYYKGADLFIFPSFYEGFGLPPLEALAVGKNVICSDIPVLREVCKDMVDYFDPSDIKDICNKILRNINKKSIKYDVSKYNWEISVIDYINYIGSKYDVS